MDIIMDENNNDLRSISSLRDRRTGLVPDPSGADSFTVSGRTPQLELIAATNRLRIFYR